MTGDIHFLTGSNAKTITCDSLIATTRGRPPLRHCRKRRIYGGAGRRTRGIRMFVGPLHERQPIKIV